MTKKTAPKAPEAEKAEAPAAAAEAPAQESAPKEIALKATLTDKSLKSLYRKLAKATAKAGDKDLNVNIAIRLERKSVRRLEKLLGLEKGALAEQFKAKA